MPKNRLTYSEQKKRDKMWHQGYLWCCECKQFLHVSNFYKEKRQNPRPSDYGYRKYCKDCNQKQRLKRSNQIKNYFKNKHRDLKRKAVELMGGKCQKCGYDNFVTALEFHHVYPATKNGTPTAILYQKGINGALEELDKCCLLCSNCHQSYKGREWQAEFIKRDGCGYTIGRPLSLDDERYDQKSPQLEQVSLPLTYGHPQPKQLKLLEMSILLPIR